MSEISPDDFPKFLTREDIEKLSALVIKNPIATEWKMIASRLTPEQKVAINKRVDDKKLSKQRSTQSDAKLPIDDETWEDMKKRVEAAKFYGNMGQPETPEEYKNRYGVWRQVPKKPKNQ